MRRLLWSLALVAACKPTLTSPTPSLSSLEPALVCNDQLTTTVTVRGASMTPVPTEVLGETVLAIPDLALSSGAGTVDLDETAGSADNVTWQAADTMTFDVTPGRLEPGLYDLSLTQLDGQSATLPGALAVVPAPVITAIVPDTVCVNNGDTPVTIEGTGFVVVDGTTMPTVTVDGAERTVSGADGCVAIDGPVAAEACTSLDITVPATTLGVGTYEVVVTNPGPANCTTETPSTIAVVDPPTITSVEPDAICDSGGSVTITGTGFTPSAVVEIDGVQSTEVQFISDTEIVATLPGGIGTGLQDVVVSTSAGCAATAVASIEVVPAPLLFYVDPPVAYNGVNIDATLYIAGVTGSITDVWLEDSTGARTDLVFDATDPDQVHATIPAGLLDGDYDVNVLQDGTCPAFLDQGLHVEDTPTVAIEAMDPPFAWTGDYTPVRVLATDPAPTGEVQFADLPRVYLTPTSDPTALAAPVDSLSFIDPTALDAVVRPGLAPDVYDVIVVNPDGAVGVLPGGLEVVANPPPRVDAISPPSIANTGAPTIDLVGGDFRNSTVTFECRVPGSTNPPTTSTVTPTTVTGALIDNVTVPVGTLGVGVCLVTVTNDDGTTFVYSSLSITSPSQNLYPFVESAAAMSAPRRAPAAVTGRATASARYLYAVGGDGGAVASAVDTIEASGVDRYGALDGFFALPGRLPEARTLAGAVRVGRFVYVIGGHDGETTVDPGPQSTVFRAQILDPLAAPRITDLSVDYGDGTALGGGTWSWRVSALFPSTDPSNPGGESLASDPIVARLPAIPDQFDVAITWTAVTGASGYRIYRTPAADAGSGSEAWVMDVTTTSFTDDGTVFDGTKTPLPKGSFGAFATMPPLPGPRAAPCVGVGRDPATPSVSYLYVAGGVDAANTLHREIYRLPVTDAGMAQTVGTWATDDDQLPAAVHECAAWTVDSAYHTVVAANDTWMYFGGGRDSATAASAIGDIAGGQVTAGGDLGTFAVVRSMNPDRAGFAAFSASDFLYMIGGQNAGPSAQGKSVHIDGPPALDSSFNAGFDVTVGRYLPGSAQESGVVFVVGGATSAGVSDKVEAANF